MSSQAGLQSSQSRASRLAMLLPRGSVLNSMVSFLGKLIPSGKVLQFYTLEEVGTHDNFQDCWIVLFDHVYNITDFIQLHPGGETVLLEHAGRDATFTFLSTGHGETMMTVLNSYLVGTLPDDQQIFHDKDTE